MNNFIKSQNTEAQIGIGYALLAFSAWGFIPIYWKLLNTVPSMEILTHRMVWSVFFLLGLLAVQKRLGEFRELFHSPKYIFMLLGTATLLGVNWFVYIYGVNTNQVIETSLGYFISPLLVILLGAVFLRERLNIWQVVAVGFAALGVLNFIWNFGSLPWIALSLAFTFSFYGLFRKMIPVKPLVGLLMETALLAPLAVVLILFWKVDGTGHFGTAWMTDFLLFGAGVVTSLPLLWFINSGKRLHYSTIGFFQYLTPSIQLAIGVYLYNETFTTTHAVTFGLIWTGLIIYSINTIQTYQHINTNQQ
ncbi:MAG: EamA family transporter RarD [Deltaproteobacteria bacterium]|nr:EamA family transporter RarD [Deltaproteobacteria bacterium]MBT5486249.1 EamA family transporter RarD [Deltaproteobacteria bacterium]MBT5835131.1 EamA family transporter RarD [Deltaproteobacteria bacterium]MBT7811275.1 EamA family transporter RarD [Deltaproteobacteria bacterium]